MSIQKLLPPPVKSGQLTAVFTRIPIFAIEADLDDWLRWDKAGKPEIIDGKRAGTLASAPREMCDPPYLVQENNTSIPGVPRHLTWMYHLFELTRKEGRKIFSVYFNRHSKMLNCTIHDVPEEAFTAAVDQSLNGKKLILCLDTAQDFAAQLRNKNGPYISPLHCLAGRGPIVTEGTIGEPQKIQKADPRPEEYWYR